HERSASKPQVVDRKWDLPADLRRRGQDSNEPPGKRQRPLMSAPAALKGPRDPGAAGRPDLPHYRLSSRPPNRAEPLLRVLAIESSCDESAAAVLDRDRGLLAHELFSQIELHRLYGGVVPELASRDHIRRLLPLVRSVLES